MKLQNIDFLLPWVFKRELAAALGFYYGYNIQSLFAKRRNKLNILQLLLVFLRNVSHSGVQLKLHYFKIKL